MVSDSFGVDVGGAASVADDLEEAGSKLTAIWQTLRESAGALVNVDDPGQPIWGVNQQGDQFAKGANGYLAQNDGSEVAADAKAPPAEPPWRHRASDRGWCSSSGRLLADGDRDPDFKEERNRRHRHSSLGYRTPAEYAAACTCTHTPVACEMN